MFCMVLFSFQIVVVFYVGIVLLLIGTNLRANRVTGGSSGESGSRKNREEKKHVVELSEAGKAETKLVREGGGGGGGGGGIGEFECEEEVVDV